MNKSGFAWVTLATNDSYSLGALVLAHSLRRVNTQYDLVILITPGVTQLMKEKLLADFTLVKEVNVLDSKDEANLHLLQRPELGITFTKLHCWKLTEYKKCVFIDADALVIRNCDDIFVYEQLSAAPDVGWPDCFNSGVFVFEPSEETFDSLIKFAAIHGSFDGADQGLLNLYFSDWAHKDISKHLPFTYNTSSAATYSYFAALKQYGQSVRIIHFIGNNKPWLQKFDRLTGTIDGAANFSHLKPFLKIWWNIFYHDVHPKLADNMDGLAGSLSKLHFNDGRTDEQKEIEDHVRKQNWEQGQVDFMGRDSFDNILKKINSTLFSAPSKELLLSKEIRESTKNVTEKVQSIQDFQVAEKMLD